MTIVYVDLLFLLNLVANYLLLLGSGRVAGAVLRRWRIGGGAALGAMYAVAVFLPGLSWLSSWPCKAGIGILIVLTAYGSTPRLLRVTAIFFAASAALAGMVMGIELLGASYLTVKSGVFYSSVDIRLLLLLFVLCYFILSLFFRRMGRHNPRELIKLDILLADQNFSLTALLDSGHTLTDSVTNKTIIITDWRYLRSALPEEIHPNDPVESLKHCRKAGLKGARLIPYRAVGVDCGMLLALKADEVAANGRVLGSLLVALSPTPVDDGGRYQALIGGTL